LRDIMTPEVSPARARLRFPFAPVGKSPAMDSDAQDFPGHAASKGAIHVLTPFASEQLSSYYTGEVLAPVGGEMLPG
jgi:hypothetical protein